LQLASGMLIAVLGAYIVCAGLAKLKRDCNAPRRRAGILAVGAAVGAPMSGNVKRQCSCNHAHFVEPRHVAGAWSWRIAWAMALSVGVRPCTGAVLLLMFARSQGMLWAGLIGTLAMALGTAATVSALVMAAVRSRAWAAHTLSPSPVLAGAFRGSVMLLAGIALVGIGAAMAFAPEPRSPF
jgi:ABC-type nickel/cobalt efflux system permease component RcnA